MHGMMRRRDDYAVHLLQGEASDVVKDEDGGTDDLQLFLDRFDIQKK
jgi:hypothetical protein